MLLKMFRTPEFWYKKNIISKLQIILLYPFSILWTLVDEFKRYFSKTYKSKLKVVCIGNLTVGGTGKTPFSIYTFKILKSLGYNPVFLTRGYGGLKKGPIEVNNSHHFQDVGDESILLSKVGTTIVSRNRSLGAKFIEKHFVLNDTEPTVDSFFSLTEDEFSEMVEAVRESELAIGKIDYSLSEKQKSARNYSRSLYVSEDVKKGDIVVFYDGNNDTLSNCNTLNGPNGHGEVGHFRELLKEEKQLIKLKFNYLKIQDFIYTSNTFAVINGVFKRFFSLNLLNLREPDQLRTTNFGCDKEEYAFAVAKNVVRHWKVAETIVKDKNAKFICVLQPTPYTSTFKVNQPVRLVWKRSIEKVYPAIKKFSKNLDCFNDLSEVLDRDYYIDNCCHLNSEGNKVIANEIMKVVRGRLETP